MRVLITGVAGFIGSTIARKHIAAGDEVVGIDSFTDYYATEQKKSNIAPVMDRFARFEESDLLTANLSELVSNVDVIYHQAGQPGVRKSWGRDFEHYTYNNVRATQALLEAVVGSATLSRFVYASSSSVYGDSETYPTTELTLPRPMSPYGVTKLAAEHLATLYAKNYSVPTVSLRYFTVYGPRQRPDMAFHKFFKAHIEGRELEIYGDGTQIRDFTFVDDVVAANIAAAQSRCSPGEVINVSGGSSVSVNEVLDIIGEISGTPPKVSYIDKIAGDVYRTGGSTDHAADVLNWRPQIDLRSGLTAEYEWVKSYYA